MPTAALTLQDQAQALQVDLRENLELFFAQLPELSSITAQSQALVAQSAAIIVFRREPSGKIAINDHEAYKQADEQVKALKAVESQFGEIIDPYVKKAYELHRSLTSIRKTYLAESQAVIARLNQEMTQSHNEDERLRREAQQRESEAAQERERARLLAEAAQVEKSGDQDLANEILQEALNVEAPVIQLPKNTPEVAGESYRSVPKFEILDITKLKPEYLIANEKAIGALVRSMGEQAAHLVGAPGAVRVWIEKTRVSRG